MENLSHIFYDRPGKLGGVTSCELRTEGHGEFRERVTDGVPICRPPDTQCIAALGVARLASLAAGGDFSDVVPASLGSQEIFPDGERHSILSQRPTSFRGL